MFSRNSIINRWFISLVYGADRLVYGVAVISRSLGVPPPIIGMTIVGIGTSLPELIAHHRRAERADRLRPLATVLGLQHHQHY